MTNEYLTDIIKEKVTTQCEDRIIKDFASKGRIFTDNTELSALSDENDKFSTLSTSAMLARGEVPPSHRRIADNYMIIKKIYGFPVVQSRIDNQEKSVLAKYDFNQLEYSTIKQINEELSFLKKWSLSLEPELRKDADDIMQIRSKELKFLVATRYTVVTNEIFNGYMALEKYFEDISKYNRY